MRFIRSLAPLLVIALSLGGAAAARSEGPNALDSGTPIETTWSATPKFGALTAVGPDNVRFSTGERWQVRAEGDPRTLARIRFIIRDGALIVGRKSGERAELRPATIYVIAPSLHRATIGGSGSLAIDRLSGKKVSATVAGSGGLSVDHVAAESLDASIGGSGDMTLSGRTGKGSLAIAGSGDLRAAGLVVDSASTSIAGSGSMAFRSDGSVSAAIIGSGSVVVRGSADCSKLTRVGSGTLSCRT